MDTVGILVFRDIVDIQDIHLFQDIAGIVLYQDIADIVLFQDIVAILVYQDIQVNRAILGTVDIPVFLVILGTVDIPVFQDTAVILQFLDTRDIPVCLAIVGILVIVLFQDIVGIVLYRVIVAILVYQDTQVNRVILGIVESLDIRDIQFLDILDTADILAHQGIAVIPVCQVIVGIQVIVLFQDTAGTVLLERLGIQDTVPLVHQDILDILGILGIPVCQVIVAIVHKVGIVAILVHQVILVIAP